MVGIKTTWDGGSIECKVRARNELKSLEKMGGKEVRNRTVFGGRHGSSENLLDKRFMRKS